MLAASVPADVDDFCSGYEAADEAGRSQFWLMLISAIAKEESDFDPNCVYHEPLLLDVDSLGLMELSVGDAHYGCDFPDEDAVKDPRRNLLCAVRIIDKLVGRDGRIGGDADHHNRGAAAYWSTLRVPKPGKRDARGYVISRTSASGIAEGAVMDQHRSVRVSTLRHARICITLLPRMAAARKLLHRQHPKRALGEIQVEPYLALQTRASLLDRGIVFHAGERHMAREMSVPFGDERSPAVGRVRTSSSRIQMPA